MSPAWSTLYSCEHGLHCAVCEHGLLYCCGHTNLGESDNFEMKTLIYKHKLCGVKIFTLFYIHISY